MDAVIYLCTMLKGEENRVIQTRTSKEMVTKVYGELEQNYKKIKAASKKI